MPILNPPEQNLQLVIPLRIIRIVKKTMNRTEPSNRTEVKITKLLCLVSEQNHIVQNGFRIKPNQTNNFGLVRFLIN